MKQIPSLKWCFSNCSKFAAECSYRSGGRIYHNIRKDASWDDCWRIVAMNFTRCGVVEVYTPKDPTQDEVDRTRIFLIEELEDIDAADEYEELLE